MQSFKVLLSRRLKYKYRNSSQSKRGLCSFSNVNNGGCSTDHCNDLDSLVLVEERASSRTVILNRPHLLNSLITPMGVRLNKLYESWEQDSQVGFVVIKGNGRSFSAGGDVVNMYRLINEGRLEECKDIFRTFYSFIYLVGTYLKPHVAILDGITMGGGGGISVPGSYRVATDKTVFATPEILIGFHPDGGASYYLSRLSGHFGEYLALTGNTLCGEEMLACGLATHYSLSARLPMIEDRLGRLVTDDFSVMESFLSTYTQPGILNDACILHRIEMVNKCFGQGSVEEIIDALEIEAAKTKDEWCISTLNKLKNAPPLSLKVSLKSIREGRFQTLQQCLAREYYMTLQAISGQISTDFCEGIRARMVDKCFTPKWDPPCLKQVSEDMVKAYFFKPNSYEPDLELPNRPSSTWEKASYMQLAASYKQT
ncbi:hypothetical protein ACOSP7_025504 [Xanthoceras sorbifolium]